MKSVYCNEVLPETTRKLRQILREIGCHAVKTGYKGVKVMGNKIQVDGETYYKRDLKLLPSELHIENIKVRTINDRVCFEGDMAYLSSSHHSPIRMNDNFFYSAEQAFFYHMAIYTGRSDYATEILEYNDSKALKKMGKKIGHDAKWEENQLRILKGITLLKFQQNPALKSKLLETSETPLYNCDQDAYWGTGRSMDSTQWDDTMLYPGTNALGMILDDVRRRLRPAGYELPRPALDLSPVTNIIPARPQTISAQPQTESQPIPMEGVVDDPKGSEDGIETKKTSCNKEGETPLILGAPQSAKGAPQSAKDMAATIAPTIIPNANSVV